MFFRLINSEFLLFAERTYNGKSDNIPKILIGILIAVVISLSLYFILRSPFKYPYFINSFDVTGKRNPKMEDYIDNYLIKGGFSKIIEHEVLIEEWKSDCQHKLEKCILKNYRREQYNDCLDENNAYVFEFVRNRTRYRQSNYVKYPYTVTTVDKTFACSYYYLLERETNLNKINKESTLNDYFRANQRSLMTKELREKIKIRDHFTCQICGKYMPDEVGLQIDHIIPVAKGGRTVESNLQVLCSKCNGRKSSKI